MTRLTLLLALTGLTGCMGATEPPVTDDPQLPPTGASALRGWLAQGHYKAWHCEPAPHDARPPSPHGRNRVCNNHKVATHTGTDPYPDGAANVKELVDAQGNVTGHAVSRRTRPEGNEEGWYWFEQTDSRVIVDGQAVPVCVGCHGAAGSDAQHPGQDYVFTRVP